MKEKNVPKRHIEYNSDGYNSIEQNPSNSNSLFFFFAERSAFTTYILQASV